MSQTFRRSSRFQDAPSEYAMKILKLGCTHHADWPCPIQTIGSASYKNHARAAEGKQQCAFPQTSPLRRERCHALIPSFLEDACCPWRLPKNIDDVLGPGKGLNDGGLEIQSQCKGIHVNLQGYIGLGECCCQSGESNEQEHGK